MKIGKCEGGSNLTELPSILKSEDCLLFLWKNVKRHVSEEEKERKIQVCRIVFTDLASFEDILSVFEIFTLSFHTGKSGRKGNHIHTVTSSIREQWIFHTLRPFHTNNKKDNNDNYYLLA